jgi:hypothetical protein
MGEPVDLFDRGRGAAEQSIRPLGRNAEPTS